MVVSALLIFLILGATFLVNFIMDFIRRRKEVQKYHKGDVVMSYIMLAPAILLAFFFVVLPIFFSLRYAFTDFNLLYADDINDVGFDNFIQIFKEFGKKLDIYYALRNTGLFVIFVVPVQIGLALLLALFCNNKRRGTTIFKVCFFAPVAISLTVTAYLWKEILTGDPDGIMNSILGWFGLDAHDFLRDKDQVVMWLVIISAWQGCGFQMLIFLSALGNIRKDLYEAASIDGANVFRRFFTVTLPGLKSTMLYIVITVTIGACRVLIQPMLIYGYQPDSVTLSYFIWYQGYKSSLVGFSCAVAFLMTIVMGTITFIQRKLLGGKAA